MQKNQLYQPFQPLLTNKGRQSFGLSVQQYPAKGRLAGAIHSYLQVTTPKPTLYPMIPDGTQAIFISEESIQIGGAHSQSMDIQIHQAGDYFGIRFYPGALRHFFKLNLSEITGQFVDSQYFPCRIFADLHHHIYKQKEFLNRAHVCEKWLLQHFTPQSPCAFDLALSLIYQSSGNIEISNLANKTGLSSRHLNRLFQQYTGLNTKKFSQIIRIQNVCKRLYETPNNSLEMAIDSGFFDQAHLLNEYKRFLLVNPRSLFNRFVSDYYNNKGL
ncbi:MAG: helix-turn-helix domain-containing protein [Gammaproteobacteria bacterium]|nr:helix-turn-helix domain-containing protein [Gammaproteobacteria bacterium]